jgi:hypothetical protein
LDPAVDAEAFMFVGRGLGREAEGIALAEELQGDLTFSPLR